MNEIERCYLCGEYTGPDRSFCAPAEGREPSFCELAYQRRVNNGMPLTQWRPWGEEAERRHLAGRQVAVPSGFGGRGDKGGEICSLPECDEAVEPHQMYCTEAHRAKAYRMRKRGEL